MKYLKTGVIVTPPDISTDFYSKLQGLLLLVASPESLVKLKEEYGEEEYLKMVSPAFEFMSAFEEKMINENKATDE
jgi:hypothetical protein